MRFGAVVGGGLLFPIPQSQKDDEGLAAWPPRAAIEPAAAPMPLAATVGWVAASTLLARAGGQSSTEADFVRIDTPLTWTAARDACQTQYNGDLASIRSVEEQAAIGRVCGAATSLGYGTEGTETAADNHYKACWIGLTDSSVRCRRPR